MSIDVNALQELPQITREPLAAVPICKYTQLCRTSCRITDLPF